MSKTISVIGSGVAGLASAIRLQKAGYQVTIFEKEALPGGKMHQIKKDGFTFDLGPSIVMMPEIYQEIFEIAGYNPDDYIPMKRLDPMYTSYYGENKDKTVEFSSDLVKLQKMFQEVEPTDFRGFLNYLSDIYERFEIARDHFLQRPFLEWNDFYNPKTLYHGYQLKTLNSTNKMLDAYMDNTLLKNLISFQTLYIGISPQDGPSLYSIIPMIELLYGVWFIEGGMYQMAKSMAEVFEDLGGKIEYNATVSNILIDEGVANGIKVNDEIVLSDYVLCNADFPYAMKNLIAHPHKGKYTDEKIDKMDYSCSCLLFYWGMDRKYDDIQDVHTFIFSNDLDNNMAQVFSGNFMEDPSFYVYMGSKVDPSLAPEGKDGLYVLMPVSELSTANYPYDDEHIQAYKEKILAQLAKIDGFGDISEHIESETIMTPNDFEEKFHAYNGATFGLRPTLRQSNHWRPQVKQPHLENLYFAGSSVHPGAGVPIVMLSAKIAAEQLMKDDHKE